MTFPSKRLRTYLMSAWLGAVALPLIAAFLLIVWVGSLLVLVHLFGWAYGSLLYLMSVGAGCGALYERVKEME